MRREDSMFRRLGGTIAGIAGALFAVSSEASTSRDTDGASPASARILALPPAPANVEGGVMVAGNSSSNSSSNSSGGVHTLRRDHRWSEGGRRGGYSDERHWRDVDDRRRYYYAPPPSQHYHLHLPPLGGPPRRN
jgi:hypothetical protein